MVKVKTKDKVYHHSEKLPPTRSYEARSGTGQHANFDDRDVIIMPPSKGERNYNFISLFIYFNLYTPAKTINRKTVIIC